MSCVTTRVPVIVTLASAPRGPWMVTAGAVMVSIVPTWISARPPLRKCSRWPLQSDTTLSPAAVLPNRCITSTVARDPMSSSCTVAICAWPVSSIAVTMPFITCDRRSIVSSMTCSLWCGQRRDGAVEFRRGCMALTLSLAALPDALVDPVVRSHAYHAQRCHRALVAELVGHAGDQHVAVDAAIRVEDSNHLVRPPQRVLRPGAPVQHGIGQPVRLPLRNSQHPLSVLFPPLGEEHGLIQRVQ